MDELRSTECEYVIIGGGIAGWIIASRLSEEPNARVLILESSRYPSDPYIFASVLDTCWSSDYIQASFDQARVSSDSGPFDHRCHLRSDLEIWRSFGHPAFSRNSMTPYFRKNQGLMRDPRWIQDTLERPNLSLVTGATALRVLFHEGVKPAVARGVRVAWKRGLVDVNVRKEVVVAAGFHQTPELLYISMIKENVHAYEHLTRRQAGETNLHGGPEGLTVAPTHTIVSTYSDGTQRSHCPHPACSVSEVGVFHYVWLLVSLLLMMTKGRGPLRNRRYLGYDSSPSRQDCPCPTMKGVGPGVIGGDLIMHGTLNLRVVDASIFPITRRCHFQSVYAVAEKAADLMKAVM